MEIRAVKYVKGSELLPNEDWNDWFWDELSTETPLQWGDMNSYTLIEAGRFKGIIETVLHEMRSNNRYIVYGIKQGEVDELIKVLDRFIEASVYIDLEG